MFGVVTAKVDPWAFTPHPDVWAVMITIIVGYWYFLARVGPTVDRKNFDGMPAPIATRREVARFVAGWLVLWAAADYPIHDIGEKYLFSVHMVQHLMISLIAAPLLFLGIPEWLQRRLWGSGWPARALKFLGRPFIAGGIYTVWLVFSHWPVAMDAALNHHALHFAFHVMLFATASLMWFPVFNKNPDLPKLGEVGRMVYVFLQSILPTVPAAFYTFANNPVYSFYAHAPHPFKSFDAVSDQQLAGAIMKVGGGAVMWLIIATMFFRWSARDEKERIARRRVLTWDEVQTELDRTKAPSPG